MFSDLDSARPVHLHRVFQVYGHIIPSLVFFFREVSALKIIKKMVSTKVPSEEFVTGPRERIGWQSAILMVHFGCFDATVRIRDTVKSFATTGYSILSEKKNP